MHMEQAQQDLEQVRSLRQGLHHRLGLPQDRPLLRMANALNFEEAAASTASTSRLRDVHVGIADSGIPGGSVHMVAGSYDYHHYMQVCWSPPLQDWACSLCTCSRARPRLFIAHDLALALSRQPCASGLTPEPCTRHREAK